MSSFDAILYKTPKDEWFIDIFALEDTIRHCEDKLLWKANNRPTKRISIERFEHITELKML